MNELTLKTVEATLQTIKPEYRVMLKNIDEKLPIASEVSKSFYKSHSQYMGVTVDITSLTPIRSIKHTLAEIDNTRMAMEESHIKMQKTQVKLKKKYRKLENCDDEFERELIQISIIANEKGLQNSQNYFEGAIRKLNSFLTQYENLLAYHKIDHVTEEMYEIEEARYHVMTVFKQGLCAARTRSGVTDEGNHIYAFDIGINGATFQQEIFNYLKVENEIISKGSQPTQEMTMKWLEACADKFAENGKAWATRRGFKILDKSSLTTTKKLQAAE